MKGPFIEFHTQNFNKNITQLLFVLSNKDIIVNLHKLCFLSSYLSSQPNKRVFYPYIFLPPNKHHEEKLKYFRFLHFSIPPTKQALTSSYHYRYQEFSTKIPLNISHRYQQFSTKIPQYQDLIGKKKQRENLGRGSRAHITLDAFTNDKIHVTTIFQNGT